MNKLWLLSWGVACTCIMQVLAADVQPSARSNVHLRAVEKAILEKSTNAMHDVSSLSNAMSELRSGIETLSGKTLADMKNQGGLAEQNRQVEKSLLVLSESYGLQLAVAVLLDSFSTDDLVRQAAYRSLMTRDRYEVADLELLCVAMAFQPQQDMDTPARRVWLSAATFRSRMEPVIVDLLNLHPAELKEAEASSDLARTNPLEWLTRVLRKAESRESNGFRLEHIRSALMNLRSK